MGKTRGSQSFIKNFFVLGFGSFIYLVIGLIGTPVITRLVDPAEYGYMSMFTVYSNIGLMFCGLGLDQTLVRYFYHRDDLDYKRMILFECMSAPMILCAVLGLLILPAALFTNDGLDEPTNLRAGAVGDQCFCSGGTSLRYPFAASPVSYKTVFNDQYHPESDLSYHCSCSGRVVEGLLLLHPCGLHDPEHLDRNSMRFAVGKGSVGLPRSVQGKLDPAKGTAVL